ncbi:BEL1-like homeodomain protein 8 [Euphorbia lathyris]|uniref:BEL1-like homeodomain protein 8 n=1 Tax=Euphorbia lathyris TaxID=212925 RepID=UPI003313AD81
MDSRILRPESHIAQQSRRDKLRIQPSFGFPNDFENLNPDLVQVRNVRNGGDVFYDPIFSSQMLNFSMVGQELVPLQPNRLMDSSSSSYPISSNFSSTPKMSTNIDNWRSVDSHQNYEWTVNYASGSSSSVGREANQKPIFVGDVLSNNARVSSSSTSIQYLKPHYNGFHHLDQSSSLPINPLINDEIQDHNQKQQLRDQMQFSYNHINSLQDVVTPTSLYLDNNSHQWSSELGLITRKNDQDQVLRNTSVATDPNTQGLSLSLSSNPPSRGNNIIAELGERYEAEYLQSKLVTSDYLCPKVSAKPPGVNSGKSPNEMTGTGTSNYALRNVGPLGPFTGYATILKSSKFLKPAQDLLDDFCNSTGSKLIPASICGEANSSLVTIDAGEAGAKDNNNDCGMISSATFYNSNGSIRDVGMASTSGESYRPEYHQRKAKLLYLQEEVCRKHKQYHQQMQMVASSFEAVSGLSDATPYVSLALKMVSRNFRDLKHAISDQLKRITRALGDDLLSPNVGGSGTRGDTSTSKMRYMDQTLQRLKSGGANPSFFEPQPHVWRPQRGLPERSVAILKAWLYEHFLHPYPSDTDKHLLASQTGLSRNQVSNWFINARVRVWKPMVEEIHMLETKGMAETNKNCGNNEGKSAESTGQQNYEEAMNNVASHSMMNKQLECSGSSGGSGEQMNNEQWNQEKRSRIEFEVPSNMDGPVMNFLPYQRSGIDIGAIGAVSLTLGLRHSVDINVQQQQQLQPHEDQLRRQFGGQMIHDFVG